MIRYAIFSAAVLTVSPVCLSAQPQFNVEGGRQAERCSDLRVRTSREFSQATENFTLSKSAAPTLEVDARDHAELRVRGWDRPDYAVEVCKFAVADTRSAADQELRSIAVTRNGGRFAATGPDRDRSWHVVFFVHAPKDASLNLESGNAPVEAAGVAGKLTIRAENGPLSLDRCSGTIDAETTNGPISMNGGAGDVRLLASNGPISLHLDDDVWNGSQLEARTSNGPLSVSLPSSFRSGVRLETSGHAPISCGLDACQGARTEGNRFFPQMMQLNGTSDVIRLSTHSGPVSIRSARDRTRPL